MFLFFLTLFNTIGQEGKVSVYAIDSTKSVFRISGLSKPGNLLVKKANSQRAIWGSFRLQKNELFFYSRVPLKSNIIYQLTSGNELSSKVLTSFELSELLAPSKTSVLNIYPLPSRLPENLLRIHIEFSRVMSRGDAYKHISLFNKTTGRVEKDAFANTKYELWSENGKILTLYFDPGRIKTGLSLNKEFGLPLRLGNHYELVINSEWRDIHGVQLEQGITKKIEVQKKVNERLSIYGFRISASPALIAVDFGRIINQYQIQDFIKVFFEEKEVRGVWSTDSDSRVCFTPEKKLRKGRYLVKISSELEDVSGNSFRRRFEEPIWTIYSEPFVIERIIHISNNFNTEKNEKNTKSDYITNIDYHQFQ